MKQLTMIQEGASPLVIDDNDDTPLDEYTKELSRVLENNNISIIETSSCSVITRPNKITSIVVRNFPSTSTDNEKADKVKEEKKKEGDDSSDGIISD